MINERRATLGDKVFSGDNVTLKGVAIKPLNTDQVVLIVLNKPVGIVCTSAPTDKRNIVDFVGYRTRIFPVGRLDKDSQGLIVLTNRGDLVNRILRSDYLHEKEYVVTVNKDITQDFIAGMSLGVPILGVVTKECLVEKLSQRTFRIILVQGLNRQIRRMCQHFNYAVANLERVRVMHMTLNGLGIGQWREMSSEERSALLNALDSASSENVTAFKA